MPKISRGRAVAYLLILLGAISMVLRFALGLGAVTNLNDGHPWGLWIAFDVMTGVALAAGGFTLSAAVYVFDLKKFHGLVRPAKLSAFIGYALVVVGILVDLGLPWRIWHALVMWNTSSVLFEVAWCVMLYTSVLAVDVLAMALEALKMERAVRFFRSIYIFLVVAGIVLSTLHQSSLGALFLIVPEKRSELWASPALGPLFYASAIVAGLSVVTLENILGAHPAVKYVAVIGVPHEKWGEAVKAVVTVHPGKNVTEKDLVDLCRGKIAGYKIPKSIDFIKDEEMPMTPTGKILHRILRERYGKWSDVK